jgi:hypothetical protein
VVDEGGLEHGVWGIEQRAKGMMDGMMEYKTMEYCLPGGKQEILDYWKNATIQYNSLSH